MNTIKNWEKKIKGIESDIEKTRRNYEKILSGSKFGIQDYYEPNSYHPCTFLEVIDAESCYIKIYEPSVDKTHTLCTYFLVVIDPE